MSNYQTRAQIKHRIEQSKHTPGTFLFLCSEAPGVMGTASLSLQNDQNPSSALTLSLHKIYPWALSNGVLVILRSQQSRLFLTGLSIVPPLILVQHLRVVATENGARYQQLPAGGGAL